MNAEPCKCAKCGRPVPKSNSMVWFERCYDTVATGSPQPEPSESRLAGDWHLFPVPADEHGESCEGSPSRLQYFLGYPQDTRGTFGYHEVLVSPHRAALELYRREFPPEPAAATTP